MRVFFLSLVLTLVSWSFPALAADPFDSLMEVDETPRLLAPGFINTGMATRDLAMSVDGTEIYFCTNTAGYAHAVILVTRFVDNHWTEPEVVSFSGSRDYVDLEPALSPDGQSLFFYSTRPVQDGGENAQDLWVVHRQGEDWGEPENLGAPVNTEAAEFFPSVTADGTLYFCRADPTTRRHAIYRSRRQDGRYQEPEKLPAEVNSGVSQFNAWVAPDESAIIVPTAGHPDNLGGVDYWLSRRALDDTWQGPFNLGPVVNDGSRQSWSPYVSADGGKFFFMSSRIVGKPMSWPVTWSELQGRHRHPGSGRPGIFVMGADFLKELPGSGQDEKPIQPTAAAEGQKMRKIPFAHGQGRYFGLELPGLEPEIFAPARLSTGLLERDIHFSADGEMMMYGLMDLGLVTTLVSFWQDGHWTEPMTAPWHLDQDFACFESFLSPDGKTVYFLSNQAAEGQTQGRGWANQNIFFSQRVGDSWSEPAALPAPITSEAAEYFPSLASDGTLYFSREGADGQAAIWSAAAVAGGFAEPKKLPDTVNVGPNNYNAFIAADQSFIILCVGGHESNLGTADYWISHRQDDGTWLPARNLGPQFNGPDTAASSAYLSPDGKVLFFSSRRQSGFESRADEKLTRKDLWKIHTEPGRGSSDLWWVSAAVLEDLR